MAGIQLTRTQVAMNQIVTRHIYQREHRYVADGCKLRGESAA